MRLRSTLYPAPGWPPSPKPAGVVGLPYSAPHRYDGQGAGEQTPAT